ncbi:MAG: trigger factor [Clostridiales bacterium]|nr:trigger factor [Clostridiales bacterium]
MSLKNVTSPEKNISVLELHIDKAAFDDAVTKAYKKNVGKMNVPGFRKGKAPKSIIEKMYGAAVFYDDALDMLLPDLYASAVEEAKLEVVSRPEIDIVSIDENGVELTAKVYTKPVATVSKYKGLEAAKETVRVNKSEIEEEIELVRKRNGRQITLEDQPAADGDETVIDFEGFLDGVAFEGGKGEKFPLKLGSGSFIPGFEEQLVGHKAGESFDITVTFPEDYGAKELAGKEAVFKIVLHEVKRTELPEVDDEFVKDVSEFNTLDEYKADVKAKITERKQKTAEHAFEEALIDELLANTDVDVPAPMIDSEVDAQVRDYDYRLQMQGGSLDMYFQYTGMNMDKLRESFRPGAERQLRTRLALEAVVKAEAIEATEEELEEEYKKIASGYNVELEKVKESIPVAGITEDVVMRKAVELIKANAVKPAKKEAKKDTTKG